MRTVISSTDIADNYSVACENPWLDLRRNTSGRQQLQGAAVSEFDTSSSFLSDSGTRAKQIRHEAPTQPSMLFSYRIPTSDADDDVGVNGATALYAAVPESTKTGGTDQFLPSLLCQIDKQQRPCWLAPNPAQ